MIPDITRGAVSLPKTSLKNSVAMSRFLSKRWSTETAQSFTSVSRWGLLSLSAAYVCNIYQREHHPDKTHGCNRRFGKSLLRTRHFAKDLLGGHQPSWRVFQLYHLHRMVVQSQSRCIQRTIESLRSQLCRFWHLERTSVCRN